MKIGLCSLVSYMEIKLGIIEDDDRIRSNYAEFFKLHSDFRVVFSLNYLKMGFLHGQLQKPDIILLDINLPSGSSLKSISALKQLFPETKVIILTASSDQATILKSMNTGVDGYLIKNSSLQYIADMLSQTYSGGFPLSPIAAQYILNASSAEMNDANIFSELSDREMQLVKLLKTGMSNKMASEHLSITFFTVNHHLKSIYKKLNIHSKTELVAFAAQLDNTSY